MRICHILLTHFISDGHLGSFPFLFTSMNNTAINSPIHIFWGMYVRIPIGHITRYAIAGSQGTSVSAHFSHSALCRVAFHWGFEFH